MTYMFTYLEESRLVTDEELEQATQDIQKHVEDLMTRRTLTLSDLNSLESIATACLNDLTHFLVVSTSIDAFDNSVEIKIRRKPGVLVTKVDEDYNDLVH